MVNPFPCSIFRSRLSLPILLLFVIVIGAGTANSVPSNVNPSTSQTSQNSPRRDVSNRKLRLCVKSSPGLPQQDFLELPTFSVNTLNYTLEKHAVQRDGDFFICPDYRKPIALTHSHVIPKNAFDEEYQANNYSLGFVFELLRSVTFLLHDGHLSVGIGGDEAIYYSPGEYCIESVQGQGVDRSIEFKICPSPEDRPVLPKCCPIGMVLGDVTCIRAPQSEHNWDPKYLDAKTMKFVSLEGANPVYTSPKLKCAEESEFWDADNCSTEFHPVTDNRMAFIGAHRTWEFLPKNVSVCIDLQLPTGEPQRMILFHCAGSNIQNVGHNRLLTLTCFGCNSHEGKARISLLYMINMYIGASFHLLTTLVYLITWKRQNIHGRTLSSLTASLFFMHMFIGNAHLFGRYKNLQGETGCVANGIGGQYFMIAAFTWLLVVNVDLWRTFRTIRTDSNNSLKRFLKYSAWGWGFPLTITVISLILEFTFKCRTSGVPVPEYGQYYCFVAPWAQGYYVYYILGALIVLVFIFAVMTMFGLYSFKKDTSNLRSSKGNDDRQNIVLFLKLGVVMGFTWVTEVISWAATDDDDGEANKLNIVWIVFDFYNMLSAVLIFIIFVCKRTTLNLLEQSCPKLKGLSAAFGKFTNFIGESPSDNTVSTAVGGNGQSTHEPEARKKSSSSAVSQKVHFTKKPKEGNENSAYE